MLQCKKLQSYIEEFQWSKKLRKTESFSFNLNIRVPLESVNLFLHVFLCLKGADLVRILKKSFYCAFSKSRIF